MFNKIASNYDFINRVLSMNLDLLWRKKSCRLIKPNSSNLVYLDMATGTGDFLFDMYKQYSHQINQFIGIDPSEKMLNIAKKKLLKNKINNKDQINFHLGHAENMSFENESLDLITIAFGIRNVPDIHKVLSQFHSKLKKDGQLGILEFSLPQNPVLQAIYLFYLRFILPQITNILTSSREAYTYLSETIQKFPHGEKMKNIIEQNGFKNIEIYQFSMGIVSFYIAKK